MRLTQFDHRGLLFKNIVNQESLCDGGACTIPPKTNVNTAQIDDLGRGPCGGSMGEVRIARLRCR